jgi:hypothetical protein
MESQLLRHLEGTKAAARPEMAGLARGESVMK